MPSALVVNPSHRRKRRKHKRGAHGRFVRNQTPVVANRRRRRRHNAGVTGALIQNRRRRHRRNPAGAAGLLLNPAGLINTVMREGLPAAFGGAAVSFLRGKFYGGLNPIAQTGIDVAVGLLGGIGLRRIAPAAAGPFMHGVFGVIGGNFGMRMAGGLPATPKLQAMGTLISMAQEEEAQQELEGMGIVISGIGESEGEGMGEYSTKNVSYGEYSTQDVSYGDTNELEEEMMS